MRYRVGMLGVGAVLLLGASAWYCRPIVAVHRIGIPWRATLRQSHCTSVPLGELGTTNWPMRMNPPVMTTIDFEPTTRALLQAVRWWNLSDSTTWARVVDSTRRALASHGWEPLPCDARLTHFPIAEAWHVGDREVQLFAAPRIKLYEGGTRGVMSVWLQPYGGGSCGPRFRRRLLTPDEMAQRAREWLSEQLGF